MVTKHRSTVLAILIVIIAMDFVIPKSIANGQDYSHRVTILIPGSRSSHPAGDGREDGYEAAYGAFIDHLISRGFSRFILLSPKLGDIDQPNLDNYCKLWYWAIDPPNCNADGNMKDPTKIWTEAPPSYEQVDTRNSLNNTSLGLVWLIDQIIAADPQAQIDIISYSTGGAIAMLWAYNTSDEQLQHLHKIVAISSPLGGFYNEQYPLVIKQALDHILTLLYLDQAVEELNFNIDEPSLVDEIADGIEKVGSKALFISSSYDRILNGEYVKTGIWWIGGEYALRIGFHPGRWYQRGGLHCVSEYGTNTFPENPTVLRPIQFSDALYRHHAQPKSNPVAVQLVYDHLFDNFTSCTPNPSTATPTSKPENTPTVTATPTAQIENTPTQTPTPTSTKVPDKKEENIIFLPLIIR